MNLFKNGEDLFSDFMIFETSQAEAEYPTGIISENYLQREEKILSLLRKKQKKQKPFDMDQLLELVAGDVKTTFTRIRKKICMELQKSMIALFEQNPEEACEFLEERLPKGVNVEPTFTQRELTIVRSCVKDSNVHCIWIDTGFQKCCIPLGKTVSVRIERSGWILKTERKSKNNAVSVYIRDFGVYVSQLYVLQYLLEFFRKLKAEKTPEEYLNCMEVGRISRLLDDEYRLNSVEELLCPSGRIANTKSAQNLYFALLYQCDAEGIEGTLLKFLDERRECIERPMYYVLHQLQGCYRIRKDKASYEKETAADYAKSFQTKKNIPKKYLRAMQNSGFNKFFGYVEFDEDCDLALVEEMYLEYKCLAEEVGIKEYPDVSLRFRKLGHHRAGGLYYPFFACLCIDIRSPGSMAHEVGHMIDYHYDAISETAQFMDVYDRYKYLLDEYILEHPDSANVKVLKGHTKYNKTYYLQPTEVFARCFEMYLLRSRKIDNSLLKIESEFAHPVDEELDALSKIFFDGLFFAEKKGETEKNEEGKRETA